MTTMSDLPEDLVAEILSRVPITSLSAVRSTCKKWNVLSKNRIFGKEAGRNQFLGFMMKNYRVCSLRCDLHGILNDGDLVDLSVKQVSLLNQVEISQVFHCDGLLLCVPKDKSRLMVWNPYLGQTRWIQPRKSFHCCDRYALGYDSNNRNHKILRIFDYDKGNKYIFGYEMYDFSSDSWRVLNETRHWDIPDFQRGVSLKGNTYFLARWKVKGKYLLEVVDETEVVDFLLCFDFTTERFGPELELPIHSYGEDTVTLSCVKEEQLALLYQSSETETTETSEVMEIWVTTKIKHKVLSWSKFFEVDMEPLTGFVFDKFAGSFFIDEEKKVAVVFDVNGTQPTYNSRRQTAYIIGQDGYFNSVEFGILKDKDCLPLVSSSYVPSLVQLKIDQRGKRKKRGY